MKNHFAQTRNVRAFHTGLESARKGVRGRVGMALVKGEPGTGKTEAAQNLALSREWPYVRCRFVDSPKALLDRIVTELGEQPKRSQKDVYEQARNRMIDNPRPFILDEIDYIVRKHFIDVVRDLNDETNNLIVLIGEERIDTKLKVHPRFYDRIKVVIPFKRFSRADVKDLASQSCGAKLDDSAIDYIAEFSGGTFRLIAEMFETAERLAAHGAMKTVGADALKTVNKKTARRR